MRIDYKKMGERVLTLRKSKDYSQGKLAAILADEYYINCSRQHISKIEHGNNKKIDLSLLEALSDIFGCDIGYLIGEIEEHTQENKYICETLNISEKAADNIKACCHGENKDIFNALCEHDNLFNVVMPTIAECVVYKVKIDTSHYETQKRFSEYKNDKLTSLLSNVTQNLFTDFENKTIQPHLEAGIYKLSVESTKVYESVIDVVSKPQLEVNYREIDKEIEKDNREYDEYIKNTDND